MGQFTVEMRLQESTTWVKVPCIVYHGECYCVVKDDAPQRAFAKALTLCNLLNECLKAPYAMFAKDMTSKAFKANVVEGFLQSL